MDLSKSYGRVRALNTLNMTVPRGCVFGCIGPNGAGKTTLIKLLVGLLRPTSGSARVMGLDTGDHRDEIQSQVGYLSGEFTPYGDLTARQYLAYLSSLRRGVPALEVERLAERLDLKLDTKIGSLSHGNKQKVGLVQALMHEPELVILDEPSSGLDPIVQRELLSLLRDVRDRGRTVFLSSHVLSEVEAVADMVVILREGRSVVSDTMESLKGQAMRRVELTFDRPVSPEPISEVGGVIGVEVSGYSAMVTVEGSTSELFASLSSFGISGVRTFDDDLEQIFLRHYRGDS